MSEQNYEQFLNHLPPDRKAEAEKVWNIIRESMPSGYSEEIDDKYLSFKTGKDWYVALANQKNYISLHLLPIYVYPELKAKFDAANKKLKCGKGCVNFKRAEDLPLAVIAEIISATPAESHAAKLKSMKNKKA
jgi:uncharacterized protein YdhG (YjbR/CyaY superfamily)